MIRRCLVPGLCMGICLTAPAQIPTPPPAHAPRAAPAAASLRAEARKQIAAAAWPAAERRLKRALAAEPGDADARALLGSVYLWTGRHAQAVATLEPLVGVRPDDVLLQSNLALAYIKAEEADVRDVRKAASYLLAASDSAPSAEALPILAAAYKDLRASPAAAVLFADLTPRQRHRLAETLMRTEEYPEALALLEPLLPETPDDPLLLNNLAWIHAAARQPQVREPRKAIAYARQALLYQPWTLRIWHTLGEAYLAAGDWGKAYRIAHEGLRAARLGQSEQDASEFGRLLARVVRERQITDIFE
ncbi:MAG: tetratricopeptide repeat protein [Kiritimatiellae bacterium]|nr:tetratricopeptide repeat protein [Kiritimatiellia bacterium]